MTLHKIDREQLKEAMRVVAFGESSNTGPRVKYTEKYKEPPYIVLDKAAENWLTITDPGFEASESVRHAIWMCVDCLWSHVDDDCIPKIMDAMIAKAGE